MGLTLAPSNVEMVYKLMSFRSDRSCLFQWLYREFCVIAGPEIIATEQVTAVAYCERAMMGGSTIIFLMGPTAVGKTDLAISLV